MSHPVDTPKPTFFAPKVITSTTSDEMAAKLHDHIVGKTVLITGVSPTGLGAEAARVIALHAPKRVILASRSTTAMQSVIDSLAPAAVDAAGTRARIDTVELDLSSPASIHAAVETLNNGGDDGDEDDFVLDVLINNAGIMMLQTLESVAIGSGGSGGRAIEKQWATNHLGHFLLTNLLVPALRRSQAPGGARVATVSSRGYLGSSMADVLDDPQLIEDTPANRARYDPFVAYARSKTANLLFTAGLASRARKTIEAGGAAIITPITIDPGTVGTTALTRYMPIEVQQKMGWRGADGKWLPGITFMTAEQSVVSYVVAAFDPALTAQPGATITSGAVDDSILAYATDPVQADKLWALSEELVGEKFDL